MRVSEIPAILWSGPIRICLPVKKWPELINVQDIPEFDEFHSVRSVLHVTVIPVELVHDWASGFIAGGRFDGRVLWILTVTAAAGYVQR